MRGDEFGHVIQLDGYSEIGERGQIEIQRVRDHQCTRWNGDGLLAVKSQRLVAVCLYFAAPILQCDVRGNNRKRSGPEGIGEADANLPATNGNMNDLPQGCVGKS